MKKSFTMYGVILINTLFFCVEFAFANNSIYIATSNDIAKKIQLDVVSNNAANANTVGYEEDSVIFKPVSHKESKRKTDSFVVAQGNYRTGSPGSLKYTNRPLDMAVIGEGYFMVLTNKGPRYTLNGAGLVDSANTLVNQDGHPFANRDGQAITFPERYSVLEVRNDGTIYADDEQVGVIGVFGFPAGAELTKEGSALYSSKISGSPIDDKVITVVGHSLRASNVNSTKALTDVIELQRSSEASHDLVKNIASLEKTTITKLMKN